MAKKSKKKKKEKSIEESLWDTAIGLRGTVEPSEYKHVVLALLFLKFASDKFVERRKELVEEGKEKYIEMREFYNMKNVFFLPEKSRWSFIKKHMRVWIPNSLCSQSSDVSVQCEITLQIILQ